MLKSMTGYGKTQIAYNQKDITVEIRSVNHKGFEYSCRAPRMFAFLEERIKAEIQKQVNRGKIDVYVGIDLGLTDKVSIQLNVPMLNAYLDTLKILRDEYGLADDISVMTVARNNDIFDTKKEEQDQEELWEGVKQCLTQSLDCFINMRITEGKSLQDDLILRKDRVLALLGQVEKRAPMLEVDYRERLELKMKELLGDMKVDESRLLTEVAFYADRVAINEEIVRLKSHMEQFDQMLHADGPIGRKMNFLAQEMNREANTIVSKCADVEIVKIIVEMKSEIENIREQIQNIE